MVSVSRKVDQWLMIGRDVRVSPTDIDARGIRLLAKGRTLGGPDDGAGFESKYELSIGQSCQIGPHAIVTLLRVTGDNAELGVIVPPNIEVQPKEVYDQIQGH